MYIKNLMQCGLHYSSDKTRDEITIGPKPLQSFSGDCCDIVSFVVEDVGFWSLIWIVDLFGMMPLFGLHSCVENVRFVMGMGGLMKQVSLDWMWLRHFHKLSMFVECATLNMIFSVTYYLELHNAIPIYCTCILYFTNLC